LKPISLNEHSNLNPVDARYAEAIVANVLAESHKLERLRLDVPHGIPRLKSPGVLDRFHWPAATTVKEWLKEKKVSTLYIEPSSPWESAYAESFNSRFRDELLDRELFVSLTCPPLLYQTES
jgi:hypothetical protein